MARSRQIVGYDLGGNYCQISYFHEKLSEPQTMETKNDNYQIPLMIGLRDNVWIYGSEAEEQEKKVPGSMASDLVEKSIKGEKIEMAGKSYDAVLLLYQYIKMSLQVLDSFDYIVFTLPVISETIVVILKSIAQKLGLTKDQTYIQDYKESFCYYMFYQPKDLWQYEAALFHCENQTIHSYMLKKMDVGFGKNNFVTVEEVESQEIEELKYAYPVMNKDMAQVADVRFKVFVEHVFERKIVSSVYLTGAPFENNWYPSSLKVICNGRRAFLGNNLYSKGACYTAFRRTMGDSGGPIYLDSTKLIKRLCVRSRVKGQDNWLPLVEWGKHWYEADCSYEFLVSDLDKIEFQVDNLLEGTSENLQLSLSGIPKRQGYTVRLLMEITFEDRENCRISLRDIGFGEFYPPSGFYTETKIKLGGSNGQFGSVS